MPTLPPMLWIWRVLTIASALLPLGANAQPHAYELEATLDPEAHVVHGTGLIRWTNESSQAIDRLYFHLYLNAFESHDTVFMRESAGSLRGDRFAGSGGIEVTALSLVDGTDLLANAEHELIPNDRTQMRVTLPNAVAPGQSISIRTEFTSRLPGLFARAGHHGEFHMVGQWFPKLARLEPNGEWASFPYHGFGEFYADFARYDLTVRTPPGWKVGATGKMTEESEEQNVIVRRFVAENVHDTAFAAYPHFEERIERVGNVAVRILSPPGYGIAVDRHFETTRRGLLHFGQLYGEYPYDHLTVIVPPRGATGAAGMEYPTLFVTAGPWFSIPGMPALHDDTTAHELAHQWFQGILASNEVEWPMLDEGLTTWAHCDLLREIHGENRSALGWPFGSISMFQFYRVYTLRWREEPPPPGRSVRDFHRGEEYGRSVYGRVAITLETIHGTTGRERFLEALGRYARENRFAHPTPSDLFRAFDAVYGSGFSEQHLVPSLMNGEESDVAITSIASTGPGSRIEALRSGPRFPTTLRMRTNDDEIVLLTWDDDADTWTVEHPTPVVVQIDPASVNLLDEYRLDNLARDPRISPPPDALFARLLNAAQAMISWAGP